MINRLRNVGHPGIGDRQLLRTVFCCHEGTPRSTSLCIVSYARVTGVYKWSSKAFLEIRSLWLATENMQVLTGTCVVGEQQGRARVQEGTVITPGRDSWEWMVHEVVVVAGSTGTHSSTSIRKAIV